MVTGKCTYQLSHSRNFLATLISMNITEISVQCCNMVDHIRLGMLRELIKAFRTIKQLLEIVTAVKFCEAYSVI